MRNSRSIETSVHATGARDVRLSAIFPASVLLSSAIALPELSGEPADRPPAAQAFLDSLRRGASLHLSARISLETEEGETPDRTVSAELDWITYGRGDGLGPRHGVSFYRQRLVGVLSA